MDNLDTVNCAVCNQAMAAISWKHLVKHGMTIVDYTTTFPNHPIRSQSSLIKKQISAKKANSLRKGVPRSNEVKDKIKQTKAANPTQAWNKGIPKTQQEKDHLSRIRKQKYQSGELIHWNTGNHWSDEVKNKISQTALGQHRHYNLVSIEKRNFTYTKKKQQGWTYQSTTKLLSKLTPQNTILFNDREWLFEQHITKQNTIASICVKLGLHWKNSHKTVKAKLIEFNIPIMYWHQASSNQQREVEEFITSCGFDIITRDRTKIAPLELDIIIPSKNIAIEYCGLYWHTTEFKDPLYHKTKYDMCSAVGIRLITIYSDEWLNNSHLVKQKLKDVLGVDDRQRVFARKCSVELVGINEKREFFAQHHIQGNGPSSINVGLYYNQDLVACMGIINTGNGTFILNRYATSLKIVGGFSKLLTHTIKLFNIIQITTFADLRWSQGKMYEATGFVIDKIIPADYEYVDGEVRIHKFNFRHKYLPTRLDHYDPTISEVANTRNCNIYQIYDCGKIKYVWNTPNTSVVSSV